MKKQNGMLKNFFSLFTYKDKEEKEVFYIPEVNESTDSKEKDTGNNLKRGQNEKGKGGKGSEDKQVSKAEGEQQAEEQKNQSGEDEKSEKNDEHADINIEKSNLQGIKRIEKGENRGQSDKKNDNKGYDKQQEAKDTGGEHKKNFKFTKGSNIRIRKPIPASEFKKKKDEKEERDENTSDGDEIVKLGSDYKSNLNLIRKEFNYPTNTDLVIREFLINDKTKAFLVYMEGMVDRLTVNNFILAPILRESQKFNDVKGECKLDFIIDNVLESHQVKKLSAINDVIDEILVGDTGIYADGCDYLIFCETKGFEKRSVTIPQIESVVRGPQEAFSESVRTNITLIRRIIKDKNLTTEFITVGSSNKMNVAICYLQDVINPAIVTEVKRRLNGVKTDFIGSSGMLEQLIEDTPFSIIPTVLVTERPDRTASHIAEGKLAIIVDGTPFSIVVPVTISSLFHSPEDSALRWQYGTMLRFVRIFAVFVASMLPGLYIALTTFHMEMIPTDLLIAIAKAKENVPFPTIVEVLLMEISFELIREAGIRIPGIIGNTLGIIGALILGQAAVQANIVSPVLIIIVSITGLGNFAIPNFGLAFGARLLRFIFIFAAAVLGFYGIAVAAVIVTTLQMNVKSFGVPFYSITPKSRKSMDVILRWPVWMQELRPDNINTLDKKNQPEISRQWTKEEPNYKYGENDND